MNIPTPFVESFESQYTQLNLKYKLPNSLEKFPEVLEAVEHFITNNNKLGLVVSDGDLQYDIVNMKYWRLSDLNETKCDMTNHAYDIVVDKLYKQLDTNKSPKMLLLALDD